MCVPTYCEYSPPARPGCNHDKQTLDRSNLNNAYVSGMKEELHFVGDQLNQIQAAFGWDVWGLYIPVVVWCIWWPAWLVGSVVVLGSPKTKLKSS
ncbi:hypothetical protein NUW58_g9569 [Xylaria curta]|uniref:Uncharacterized protein n=1 Tax=Xylaria curta TaxID=42375 RepID=A0ACC1MV39_9PEZI|nr:hypothetical protein NUW58_g9569 [Xylaria curta]